MLSKEEFLNGLEFHDQIAARVKEVACKVAIIRGSIFYTNAAESSYQTFYVDNDNIAAFFEEYYRGDTVGAEVTFPMSYLWTENYAELAAEAYQKSVLEAKLAAELAAKTEQERRMIETETKERAQLERLLAKYGVPQNHK